MSKGISIQCSGLKPAASQPVPLPRYPLFTFHLVSIYSLCISAFAFPWLSPLPSTYFPLHISLSLCFLSLFTSDPWAIFQFLSFLLSLLPPCHCCFFHFTLTFSLSVHWHPPGSPLLLSQPLTPLWDFDYSMGSTPLASPRGKFSHVDWTWHATSKFLSVGLLKLTENYPPSPPWSLCSFWKIGSLYVICFLLPLATFSTFSFYNLHHQILSLPRSLDFSAHSLCHICGQVRASRSRH